MRNRLFQGSMYTACEGTINSPVYRTETNYSLIGMGLDLTIFTLFLLGDVSEVLQWERKQEMMGLVL